MGENPADTETPSPLSRLLSLIKRTDEVPVRSEGTRVLVNLVKNLWSELPDAESGNYYCKRNIFFFRLFNNFFFILIEGFSVKNLRQRLNKMEVVEPLVNMVTDSKYPILQNEGIIALTILSMDDTAKTGGMFNICKSNFFCNIYF